MNGRTDAVLLLESGICPECRARLKEKAVFGTDAKGDDYDYEGYYCPNGCVLDD